MNTAVDKYLNISYRTDLGVLFLRWPTPVSSVEFRSGYMHALEEAEQLHVRFWLYDLRSRGQASEADIEWLFKTFFPLCGKRLGSHSAFAYLISPSYYTFVKETIGLDRVEKAISNPTIKIFVSEREAVLWLTDRQHDHKS